MSRWYFRHGGKFHGSGFNNEHLPSEATFRAEVEQATSADTNKRIQFDEPYSAKETNQHTTITISGESQLQSYAGSINLEPVKKHPQEHFSKRKLHDAGKRDPSGASLAAFIIVLILLTFLLLGLLIFLISWIFVPAAIALRIALWGMLISLGLSLIISIILNIIELF